MVGGAAKRPNFVKVMRSRDEGRPGSVGGLGGVLGYVVGDLIAGERVALAVEHRANVGLLTEGQQQGAAGPRKRRRTRRL